MKSLAVLCARLCSFSIPTYFYYLLKVGKGCKNKEDHKETCVKQ